MGRSIEEVRAQLVAAVADAAPTTDARITALRKQQQKYVAYKDNPLHSTLVPSAVYVGDTYKKNPNDESIKRLYAGRYQDTYERLTEEQRAYFRNYNAYWNIESEIIAIQAEADGDTGVRWIKEQIKK